MLYTRKGDRGDSGLFGTNVRYPKDHSVYEALGTIDELISLLGVCYARAEKHLGKIDYRNEIRQIQSHLFIVQAALAGAAKSISPTHVSELEESIQNIEKMIEIPHSFIIPGTTEYSALLDHARTVARRAEREVIRTKTTHTVSDATYAYLNRLSSLLYALARYSAVNTDVKEPAPTY